MQPHLGIALALRHAPGHFLGIRVRRLCPSGLQSLRPSPRFQVADHVVKPEDGEARAGYSDAADALAEPMAIREAKASGYKLIR